MHLAHDPDDGLSAAIAQLVRHAYVEASQSDGRRAKAFELALQVYLEHNGGVATKSASLAVAEILATCKEEAWVGSKCKETTTT
jgi:hypothetical protein